MSHDLHPSASYSITLRCEYASRPGMLGLITSAVGSVGGLIGAVDIVRTGGGTTVRDITVAASDEAHERRIADAVNAVAGVRVLHVSDRTFLLHLGGKIQVSGRIPLKTRDDLSMAYTPGVARVCRAIADHADDAWNLTIKGNTIAVVSDGSAILGLGNLGPLAAMPVMEGKCLIFHEFAGVDAFPLCLDTQDPDEIVETVVRLAPVFGGIYLEDIAAPRCFAVEARLRERLDIPVFHDDQHGTAVVVFAALSNALQIVDKALADVEIVLLGAGAAGIATARILLAAGARNLIVCDRAGALYGGRRESMTAEKAELSVITNPGPRLGAVDEVVGGADVFIGLSGPNLLSPDAVRRMAPGAIVFALANPTPEVAPEAIQGDVRILATGRSDYPNQINNALAFPGIFRGALDCRASEINEAMKLAAARAIAGVVGPDQLQEDYIIPSVFDKRVVAEVAAAVRDAATATGAARRVRQVSVAV
ncbi:MAG: NAD-dependent malic enzyme [Chloroflexi bacterium]|nr:NAD-dependent malic enzyme [Chloroflexota bacterium]